MKNVRKFSSRITGAVLSLVAAISFLLTGIMLLWFGFGLWAIAPFLVGAVFAVYAVCRFKSIKDINAQTGDDMNDEEVEPTIQNGGTLWKLKKIKEGICPFCSAPLRVANGAGALYCANCGRKL